MVENFLVVSANDLADIEIKKHLGIVQAVRKSRNVGADIFASFKILLVESWLDIQATCSV